MSMNAALGSAMMAQTAIGEIVDRLRIERAGPEDGFTREYYRDLGQRIAILKSIVDTLDTDYRAGGKLEAVIVRRGQPMR